MRTKRSRVRTMVNASSIPKRNAAILANATSTRTSPLLDPMRIAAVATMIPPASAGHTANSPCRTTRRNARPRFTVRLRTTQSVTSSSRPPRHSGDKLLS
jgi:hypothetical protein